METASLLGEEIEGVCGEKEGDFRAEDYADDC